MVQVEDKAGYVVFLLDEKVLDTEEHEERPMLAIILDDLELKVSAALFGGDTHPTIDVRML